MASKVAWLDASPEEQRRVREVVQLFAQRETQDELGGRRIVVAIADILFPGTSVLHSRARYLLFIPWFCEKASRGKNPIQTLDWLEREMITAFKDADLSSEERRGLIGIEAGAGVRQLPSEAYWTALGAWGILTWPGSPAETLDRSRHLRSRRPPDDADEQSERYHGVWHSGVGTLPPGFPKDDLDGGFLLHRHEAEWLRERLLATTDDSLLAHLAREAVPLRADEPWNDPACDTAPAHVRNAVADAQRFSIASDGARRLYDLLVAERYKAEGFDAVNVDLDRYRMRIEAWARDLGHAQGLFGPSVRPEDFWTRVRTKNPNINLLTRSFFDVWFDVCRRGDNTGLADDTTLRNQIRDRERQLKGANGRLVNEKLLASWGGGSAGPTTFRWPQVVRLVNDIVDGLNRAEDDART